MQIANALLAFTDNIDRATEFTQKQLDYASNVSFPAYAAVLIFLTVVATLGIHLLCFVRPDAKNRRECSTKIADAVQTLAINDVAKVQILDEIKDWHRAHDSKLSSIREVAGKTHCEASELLRHQALQHGA